MQLYKILIGIIFIGLLSFGIVSFFKEGSQTYNPSGFNETVFNSFQRIDNITTIVEDYDDNSGDVDSNSLIDKFSSLVTSALTSAKVMKNSADIVTDMANDGIDAISVTGGTGKVLKTAIGASVSVLIIVGIFLHFLTKSERT